MKNQTFKHPVPDVILWDFLKENAAECDQYYLFDKAHYKKAVLRQFIQPFLTLIEPAYFNSKKHYVLRKMDYNHFITIVRQLCNLNKVDYETKLVYNNSTYEIVYYIYKTSPLSSSVLPPNQEIFPEGGVGS